MAAKAEQDESMQIQAYDAIRTGIVYAEYAPGDKLQVKDLCADLGLGRTPVRESLVRLRQERLVETVPQSGTYVSRISLESVEGARYVRESLESQISVEACARMDEKGLSELRELLSKERKARDTQDRRGFFDYDNLFHEKLYDIADKQKIWQWLEFISIDLQRYRWLRVQTEDLDWDSILDQHDAIFHALEKKDTDETRFLVSNHLHLLFSESAAVIRRFPDYFVAR
ncbi:MAG: GntR family transcriptional regulator [Atopobiaceae bacterium]